MTDPVTPPTESAPSVLLTVLSAEHSSLNTTRALAWGDAPSRVSGFLALIARFPSSHEGRDHH